MPSCPQTEIEMIVTKNIGEQIAELRKLKNMSQSELARLIGVSYQQLQKYEKGINRISASKLYITSAALKVDMNQFFQDLPA